MFQRKVLLFSLGCWISIILWVGIPHTAFALNQGNSSNALPNKSAAKIKVACVGDSITFGAGISDRANNSYPSLLQNTLGDDYQVDNFGFNGTSFEKSVPGSFQQLETNIGMWTKVKGNVLVDSKHSKSGTQCLQIAGGDGSSVELVIDKEIKTDGLLSLWAERWTKREPFTFRIEKFSGGNWSEIYNGDKEVRVGRAFLSHVEIPLADEAITKLRFSVTSPENTGLLIDDLQFTAAEPMAITSVEVVPLTLPALVGAEQSAIVKLKITTKGMLDPISITNVVASLVGDSSKRNVDSFQPFYGGNDSNFRWDNPMGKARTPQQGESHRFPDNQPLARGDNYIWLACKLKDDANIDETIAAQIDSIEFSDGSINHVAGKPSVQRMGVSVRDGGDNGVHTYRIPGLATTNQGTLIGVYDIRHDGSRDLPGNIDVGMSRSTDGGRTWEPMMTIMDMGNDPKWQGDGIGDPAVMVDRKTGTIWVSATWSHGNRSWNGSGPGLEPEETGQWIIVKSEDDGKTWSDPINITQQVKKAEWSFLLQGPGKGITMSDGTIIFPAQYQDPPSPDDKKTHRLPHSTFIYSRDQGETWAVASGAWDDTTEAQIVELSDGKLMLNCRNNRASKRAILTTEDMGRTWQQHPTHVEGLIEPGSCMASLINVGRELGWREIRSDADKQFLLFSNPDSPNGRNHMTIKASLDAGESWPESHHLLLDEQGGRGYSCMSMIDADTVGILYEGSQAHMTFQRVKIKDILNPPSDQKTKNPNLSEKKQSDISNGLLKIFLLTGQSNSLGTTNNPEEQNTSPTNSPLDDRIKFFYSNRNTRADRSAELIIGKSQGIRSLCTQEGYGQNPRFWGPEFGFGRQLTKNGFSNVLIIKACRAGGGNSLWNKGSRNDQMYQHVLTTTKAAVDSLPGDTDFEIAGLLYVQGESDNAIEAKAAGVRLRELWSNLKADLPNAESMKLVIGGIAAEGKNRDLVRQQQESMANNQEEVVYVDNSDLRPHLYDQLHFDKKGKLEVGKRMANAFLSLEPMHSARIQRLQEEPKLGFAEPFGDHMVLQSGQPIRVWGTGKPGTEVKIGFSSPGNQRTADVNENGIWFVELPQQQANSTGQSLALVSNDQTVEIKDVLIGEVWLCAGQSNMEWELKKSAGGRAVVDSKNDNLLRLHSCPAQARGNNGSYDPQTAQRLWPEQFSEGRWQVDSETSAADFSAVGYYFAKRLRAERGCPVGMINISAGGTPIESWISAGELANHKTLATMLDGNWLNNPVLDEWCQERARSNLRRGLAGEYVIPGDEYGPNHSFKPGFMHAASVAPYQPLSIAGVLWYQGESNAGTQARVVQYQSAFPLLVNSWRRGFQNDQLPFAFVQLPAMDRPHWPLFRDQQRRILEALENVGMAITIDVGEKGNVHPINKKPVGDRLASWALSHVYETDVVPMGPLVADHSVTQDGSVVVNFEYTGSGLRTVDGKPPGHFEIAGADNIFVPATARIVDVHQIQLTNSDVKHPVHVRYAWAPFPEPPVNLTNSAGLPASPFTTCENPR